MLLPSVLDLEYELKNENIVIMEDGEIELRDEFLSNIIRTKLLLPVERVCVFQPEVGVPSSIIIDCGDYSTFEIPSVFSSEELAIFNY